VIELVLRAPRTGPAEAGTIFVPALEDVIRIRTGEHGEGVV
jgi:nitrogen regulatory protein PII